jgi:uncharacterized protein YjgD (DUF1641 family)
MPNSDETLTEKEAAVVNAFSNVRAELGAICASLRLLQRSTQQRFAIAQRNILNNAKTGWADIVAEMSDEEITAGITGGTSSNSFMYKHIGS